MHLSQIRLSLFFPKTFVYKIEINAGDILN